MTTRAKFKLTRHRNVEMLDANWPQSVLDFWFAEIGPEQWFRKDEQFDALLRERFLKLHEELARSSAADLLSSPETALAALIALDQFPRNMFRGTPRAFETDALAREVAHGAVASGFDQAPPAERRLFFYLPFEHSESLADQERSVALTATLGNDEWTRYAEAHHAVIARFGRFPHRNAALGRTSTPEEVAFLGEPGSAF